MEIDSHTDSPMSTQSVLKTMNDTVNGWLTQGGAAVTVAIAGITWEMWIAIIGITLSLLGLVLSFHQRMFERRMLLERNRREEALYLLEVDRLKHDRRQKDVPIDHKDHRSHWVTDQESLL